MYLDVGPGDLIAFNYGDGAVGACLKIEKGKSNFDILTFVHPDGELAFFDSNTVQEMIEKGIWIRIERG